MKKVPIGDRDEPTLTLRGVRVFQGALCPATQRQIVADLREVVAAAPLFQPETTRGHKMSVRMTSAGTVGWISDRRGYRYAPRHPNGAHWPPIPPSILRGWERVADTHRAPDSCLVNYYDEGARMGMHQDRDEADLTQPVVSISLGDDALFRIGNETRGGKTDSVWLGSGDVLVLGGPARLLYHGVDRIRPGTSTLLKGGGRINLTLRVALP